MSQQSKKELEELLRVMVDRLSIACAALTALDDCINPMDKEVLTDAWAQATIIARAQNEIFAPLPSPFPLNADPRDIIRAARKNQAIDFRETDAYTAALEQARSLGRRIKEQNREKREAA